MEWVTVQRRDVIRGVRDRWLEQYKHYPDDQILGWDRTRTAGDVRKALRALNLETATTADVDAAIGATEWASLKCDFCEGDMESIIRLGEVPDSEARWVDICRECLRTVSAQERPTSTETNVNETGH